MRRGKERGTKGEEKSGGERWGRGGRCGKIMVEMGELRWEDEKWGAEENGGEEGRKRIRSVLIRGERRSEGGGGVMKSVWWRAEGREWRGNSLQCIEWTEREGKRWRG